MRGVPPPLPLGGVLYVSVLAIATCGLVYELCAGALATYLLGNSVTQFSLVIGTYLSAMGVGSYLSRYVERDLLARFVEVEVVVALVGGVSAPLLFALFAWSPAFRALLYALVALIGIGVGLELPLLIRILERQAALKDLVARVMFLDYVGALLASVLFPAVLVPRLGLLRTTLAFGLLNAAVALAATSVLGEETAPRARSRLRVLAFGAMVLLAGAFAGSAAWEHRIEADLFADPVVLRATSPYQHLTITSRGGDTRLFIDGQLQFSTVDEYRYHEALVHPVMAASRRRERVLVLGGGDGLAVREILRWPEVRQVVLVDLDPQMTKLFSSRPELEAINADSLNDPRVTVVNDDAFLWLQQQAPGGWDAVVVDFPDPNDYGLGKLYTAQFYRLLRRAMAPGAAAVVQATSPMWSPGAYWCIVGTVAAEGFSVRPYHAYVPAFGEWGFVLAGRDAAPDPEAGPMPEGLRFLDRDVLRTLFVFPQDLQRGRPADLPVNRLDNQVLVRLYEQDWRKLQGYR
ncbi:MAG: polyamine aminopropyltransferase [Myxococcota bacterium]